MNNFEMYKDVILEEVSSDSLEDGFACVLHHLRFEEECLDIPCNECFMRSLEWLLEEYERGKIWKKRRQL